MHKCVFAGMANLTCSTCVLHTVHLFYILYTSVTSYTWVLHAVHILCTPVTTSNSVLKYRSPLGSLLQVCAVLQSYTHTTSESEQ